MAKLSIHRRACEFPGAVHNHLLLHIEHCLGGATGRPGIPNHHIMLFEVFRRRPLEADRASRLWLWL
ncbi:hypothetical protein I7I53_08802 [Histoplasma capsulatum var. duboisii H88]|uniref:Uncharacterized protein n=1 Tax=Ajellomyces capsulatus (strain H88) TaxID=544711 RepID=A0A8A1L5P9_AJEC8|nr:hypothetical protein I7I53_08802 [Histoplasma capsulatum var. duboisii H88]